RKHTPPINPVLFSRGTIFTLTNSQFYPAKNPTFPGLVSRLLYHAKYPIMTCLLHAKHHEDYRGTSTVQRTLLKPKQLRETYPTQQYVYRTLNWTDVLNQLY